MNDNQVFAPLIGGGQSSTLLTVNACGMSFVHDQERVVPVCYRNKFLKRREIAIHAVDTFGHDPNAAHSAFPSPVANPVFNCPRVVVDVFAKCGPASPCSFMNTRVNERIEDEQIASLRQRCQKRNVRHIPAAEKQCRLGSEEPSSLCFEAFVLLAISA